MKETKILLSPIQIIDCKGGDFWSGIKFICQLKNREYILETLVYIENDLYDILKQLKESKLKYIQIIRTEERIDEFSLKDEVELKSLYNYKK